jgi:hypothetical protein
VGSLLLRGEPFEVYAKTQVGPHLEAPISAALTALGFNFVPESRGEDGRVRLRPVAGTWHLMVLPDKLLQQAGAEALWLL